jgi:hypothetical protein
MICRPDSGHEEWSGKQLAVIATNVVLFRCEAWGHTAGAEEVDGWSEGVSRSAQSGLQRFRKMGGHMPAVLLTLKLHSGSTIELACDRIEVSVLDENDMPGHNT